MQRYASMHVWGAHGWTLAALGKVHAFLPNLESNLLPYTVLCSLSGSSGPISTMYECLSAVYEGLWFKNEYIFLEL